MSNDLISRRALKESIRKRLCISSLDYLTPAEKVIVDEINNAPTVVNEYTKGFTDGERSGRNFPLTDEEKAIIVNQWRPKGEWVPANGTYYCSCCKHYAYESQKFDFCQDCGADMRVKRGDRE